MNPKLVDCIPSEFFIKYELVENDILGRGAFGEVKQVRHMKT